MMIKLLLAAQASCTIIPVIIQIKVAFVCNNPSIDLL
jgi:hypothetical protein